MDTVHFYNRKTKQQYVMILKISSYSVCSIFFSWTAHKIRRVWRSSVILKETTQGLKASSKKMDNTKGEENYTFRQNLQWDSPLLILFVCLLWFYEEKRGKDG